MCPRVPFNVSQAVRQKGLCCGWAKTNRTSPGLVFGGEKVKEEKKKLLFFQGLDLGKLPSSSVCHYTRCLRDVLPMYLQRLL